MKNIVKCYKDVFGYFNALKTHGVSRQVGMGQMIQFYLIIFQKS